MKSVIFKKNGVAAVDSGAMKSRDHFKNGANPKSQMSRENIVQIFNS